jgi:hypothetical protein
MKRYAFVAVCFVLACALAAPASALDLPNPIEDLKNFHEAMQEFFGVKDPVFDLIKNAPLSDDEMPVVFFLAQLAKLDPTKVLDLRHRGMSWMDITVRLGFTPEVFYVPVRTGPPYGKAYGYYKNPKHKWKTMKLADADIVNLVNLRFISEHQGEDPAVVMRMRDGGESFANIHGKVKKEKHARKQNGKDKGKGKGKKK